MERKAPDLADRIFGLPLVESKCVVMADVAFLLLTLVFFAALALIARGLDR